MRKKSCTGHDTVFARHSFQLNQAESLMVLWDQLPHLSRVCDRRYTRKRDLFWHAGLASEARLPQEKPSEIRSVEKGNLPDGMESLFDGSAGLRFARDKRMLEVRTLFCSLP